MNKKDYVFGISAGLLIGLLTLPVLRALKPELFSKFAIVVPVFFLIATPLGLIVFSYLGKRIAVLWQIGKFLVSGVLNTLVDWGVLALVTFLFRQYFKINSTDALAFGLTFYTLYKSISFVAGNINSYYWNKYWTFANGVVEKTKAQFLQFLTVSLVGFAINVGVATLIFKAFAPVGGLNADQRGIVGAAIGTIAGLAANFFGYKYIIFKEKNAAV